LLSKIFLIKGPRNKHLLQLSAKSAQGRLVEIQAIKQKSTSKILAVELVQSCKMNKIFLWLLSAIKHNSLGLIQNLIKIFSMLSQNLLPKRWTISLEDLHQVILCQLDKKVIYDHKAIVWSLRCSLKIFKSMVNF
jgi:hypothetical protein